LQQLLDLRGISKWFSGGWVRWREIHDRARVFMLDEHTRGIDVRSKGEIYDLVRRLASKGAAVLVASSELEELLRLADRIVVLHRGRMAGELARAEATEERIMQLATGGAQ
jgi:ribose transport system ATP-binding protein